MGLLRLIFQERSANEKRAKRALFLGLRALASLKVFLRSTLQAGFLLRSIDAPFF
jgi:hypothetical protein